MKIALIHCPFGHRDFSENLKVVDEEFCVAPPLVLAYVASILEKVGHRVIIIDANVLKLTKEQALRLLKDFSPQLIGFRADTYWFHRVAEWAGFFKENLRVPVVVGGINITLYPQESLSWPCFDYGIAGEANHSLPQLLCALEKGASLRGIPGLVYRDNGKVICVPVSTEPIPFDDYPFPARHLLPNHLYYSFTSQRKNFTIMVTSTGCPFHCTFCAIARLAYRERSAANVVDEIEECVRRYGVREIDFFDATFFVNKERFLEICGLLHRRGIKVEWSCRSRVDVVDEQILKEARLAGCRKIYYGIESSSPQVLEKINKRIDQPKIRHAIDLTYKCGIKALGFFMVGNPGETKESVLDSIAFAKTLKLDFIQVCRNIAKPNTDLYQQLVDAHRLDYWREYILNKRDGRPLPAPWSQLSAQETERYVRRFYREFYFRPAYMLKRIAGIKSAGELGRYAKVAARWLFCNRSDVTS
ncbi:MAG TPA: radical SAM protein [Patescibacteria group bacterium]|nr:radical SAM protein [Patescibacteria group bacterium]